MQAAWLLCKPRGEEGWEPSPALMSRAHTCLQNCPSSPGFVMEMWTLKEESIMSNYKLYYRVLSNCLLTVVMYMWFVESWCNHFGKFPPARINQGELSKSAAVGVHIMQLMGGRPAQTPFKVNLRRPILEVVHYVLTVWNILCTY